MSSEGYTLEAFTRNQPNSHQERYTCNLPCQSKEEASEFLGTTNPSRTYPTLATRARNNVGPISQVYEWIMISRKVVPIFWLTTTVFTQYVLLRSEQYRQTVLSVPGTVPVLVSYNREYRYVRGRRTRKRPYCKTVTLFGCRVSFENAASKIHILIKRKLISTNNTIQSTPSIYLQYLSSTTDHEIAAYVHCACLFSDERGFVCPGLSCYF